jgi:3-deoxy-D-manno-octulosonate 8-phosphate phosphatase (KDO 8-P phosphatase)
LQAAGVQVAIISGRRSQAVRMRCRELGIRHVFQGVENKHDVLKRLLRRLDLNDTQVACVGDDTPDIPLFVRAGFAIAVRDAHPLALAVAHCSTTLGGGQGAVREVCDWLLAARRVG